MFVKFRYKFSFNFTGARFKVVFDGYEISLSFCEVVVVDDDDREVEAFNHFLEHVAAGGEVRVFLEIHYESPLAAIHFVNTCHDARFVWTIGFFSYAAKPCALEVTANLGAFGFAIYAAAVILEGAFLTSRFVKVFVAVVDLGDVATFLTTTTNPVCNERFERLHTHG